MGVLESEDCLELRRKSTQRTKSDLAIILGTTASALHWLDRRLAFCRCVLRRRQRHGKGRRLVEVSTLLENPHVGCGEMHGDAVRCSR